MLGNYPDESIQHSGHSESLKSRMMSEVFTTLLMITAYWDMALY